MARNISSLKTGLLENATSKPPPAALFVDNDVVDGRVRFFSDSMAFASASTGSSSSPFGGANSLQQKSFKARLRAQNLQQRQQSRIGARIDDPPMAWEFGRSMSMPEESEPQKSASKQVIQHLEESSPSRGNWGDRRHSSDMTHPVADSSSATHVVGRVGRWRARCNDMWAPDVLGTNLCPQSEKSVSAAAQSRFDVICGFVARRVYRRLREGSTCSSEPPLLKLFDEKRFQTHMPEADCCADFCSRLCSFLSGRRRQSQIQDTPSVLDVPSLSPTAREVFEFTHQFATWCALPTDLVVISLVYMDRMLDECQDARGGSAQGMLTPKSWRAILIVCMLLASKAWEDICITNKEVAEFVQYTLWGVQRLELLAMDILGWNVNISADVFAPYFWAAHKVLTKGMDDLKRRICDRLPDSERHKLEHSFASSMASSGMQSGLSGMHNSASMQELQAALFAQVRLNQSQSMNSLQSAFSNISSGSLDDEPGLEEWEDQALTMTGLRVLVERIEGPHKDRIVLVKRLEDRYKKLEKLGAGGFGEVHSVAKHDNPNEIYAVKVIKQHKTPTFERHAEAITKNFVLSGIALSMNHRNITTYIEFLIDESRSSAVTSIIPVMLPLWGPDLFEWLAARKDSMSSSSRPWISEQEVAVIAKQVASALTYLHTRNPCLVHRDVKPENLRWASTAPDADLKLLDFGLVYMGGSIDELRGRRIGTTAYSSPEVLAGCVDGPPSPLNDIFSFGVILFVLLSARFPWSDDADRSRDIDLDCDPWHEVSPVVIDLVRSCLSMRQADRPTAAHVLQSSWFKEADAGRLLKVAMEVKPDCADTLRFVSHLSYIRDVGA